jgi:hypothetical protein
MLAKTQKYYENIGKNRNKTRPALPLETINFHFYIFLFYTKLPLLIDGYATVPLPLGLMD